MDFAMLLTLLFLAVGVGALVLDVLRTRAAARAEAREQVRARRGDAVLRALIEMWRVRPPALPPNGNRLFVRFVCLQPGSTGWDDWRLKALVNPDRSLVWLLDEDPGENGYAARLAAAVAEGERYGVLDGETVYLEWGLFLGDGPEEPRVIDSARPPAARKKGDEDDG